MKGRRIPLFQAFFLIAFMTTLISGSAFLGVTYYNSLKAKEMTNPKYNVVALVQTTTSSTPLRTIQLTELLGLSVDRSINLLQIDLRTSEQRLLDFPLFKQVKLKKIKPGTLHLDYELREPIAFLADLSNIAIDELGVRFPFHPFFTPKRLPEIYLGLSERSEDNPLTINALIDRALNYLQQLHPLIKPQGKYTLKRLDLSKIDRESFGQRELILVIEEHYYGNPQAIGIPFTYYVRLDPDEVQCGVTELLQMSAFLEKKSREAVASSKEESYTAILDLRIPHTCYFQ